MYVVLWRVPHGLRAPVALTYLLKQQNKGERLIADPVCRRDQCVCTRVLREVNRGVLGLPENGGLDTPLVGPLVVYCICADRLCIFTWAPPCSQRLLLHLTCPVASDPQASLSRVGEEMGDSLKLVLSQRARHQGS